MAKVQSKGCSTRQKLQENNDQSQSSSIKKATSHLKSTLSKDKIADYSVTHHNLKLKTSVSTNKDKSNHACGTVRRSVSLLNDSLMYKNVFKTALTNNVKSNYSKVSLRRSASFEHEKSDGYSVPELVKLYDNFSGQDTKSKKSPAIIRKTTSTNQAKKGQSDFLKTSSSSSQAINVKKDGHSEIDSGSKRRSNDNKSNTKKSSLPSIQEGVSKNMDCKKLSVSKAGSSQSTNAPQKYIYSPLLNYYTTMKNNVQNKLIEMSPSSFKGLNKKSGNEDSSDSKPIYLTPSKLLSVSHFPKSDTDSTPPSSNDLHPTNLSMKERISIYENLDEHISPNVGRSSSASVKYERTSVSIKRTNSLRTGGAKENSIDKMVKHYTGLLYQNFYQENSSCKTDHIHEKFQQDKKNQSDSNKTFDGIKNSNAVTSNPITITVTQDEKPSRDDLNQSINDYSDCDKWSTLSSEHGENIENKRQELEAKNNNLSVEKSRKSPSPTHRTSLSSFMSSDISSGKDWCEDPRVISLGIADGLSSKLRLFYRAKFEVLSSEVSYFRSLLILEMHFALSYPLRDTISKTEYNYLFSKLFPVRAISEKALHLLTDCFEEDVLMPHMASRIIKELTSYEFKSTYINYCKNYNLAQQTLGKLIHKHKFTKVLTSLEASPVCQNLPLNSFLILPIQRITKLPLLFESILLKVPLGMREEFENWSTAFEIFKELAKECNTACAKEEELGLRMISLTHVVNKLSFAVGVPPLGLVVPSRVFDMEDSFSIQATNQKHKETIHLFLFNDYLFFTSPLNGGKFAITGYSPRRKSSLKNLGENNNPDNLSVLLSMIYDYNAESPRMFQVLFCKSIVIKEKWLNALPDSPL